MEEERRRRMGEKKKEEKKMKKKHPEKKQPNAKTYTSSDSHGHQNKEDKTTKTYEKEK